ncbi:MAG: glycosyltransferase [Bryobacterales bacterium]|nr:glycosyltransferase [Bryobacterales bacterium]
MLSIVTPSFNQRVFLEETIRSVLLQNYPALEYMVIDGGSTDGSQELLEKYGEHLSYWISEPDKGQCDALNKGLRRSCGEIWAYINSDDRYAAGTFQKVVERFVTGDSPLWITGEATYIDVAGSFVSHLVPGAAVSVAATLTRWKGVAPVAIQVSNFMSRRVLDEFGYFDPSLHFSMDFEFGLRLMAQGITPLVISEVLAEARLHPASKTVSKGSKGEFLREDVMIAERFLYCLSDEERSAAMQHLDDARYWVWLRDLNSRNASAGLANAIGRLLRSCTTRERRFLIRRATAGMLRRWFLSGSRDNPLTS